MNRYYQLFPLTLLVVMALTLSGCVPLINMAAMQTGDSTDDMSMAEDSEEADDSMAESSDMEMMDDDSAMATVTTRSLRVRQSPNEEAEVVYGVKEGETYKVLSVSEDGLWVQLAIDDAIDGKGWVSANYVSVNGALTGGEGEMAAESATEATEAILEPTPVPAEESTETTEAVLEPTAVPAEESTETTEGILEPAAGPAEESSPDAAGEQAMGEDAMADDAMAEEEIIAPEAGYALVNTDGTRLRVRAEANTESEIAGYIYDGETYMVVEVSEDGTWVKIAGDTAEVTDNPDGGWVAAEFLVLGE